MVTMPEGRSTRQERRAITTEWRRVPFKTRVAVLKSAKRGEPHEDASVDAIAVRFANLVLEVPSVLHTIGFQLILSLALLAFAFMFEEAFPRWVAGAGGTLCLLLTLYNWDLKRDARIILSVPRD